MLRLSTQQTVSPFCTRCAGRCMSASDTAVPRWWIILFLLLVLGAGALTVRLIGGSLIVG